MPSQPVPDVTDEDVKRIALRDFGEPQLSQVMAVIEECGTQEWNRDCARVRLAILKLANGNLERLLDATKVAINDYRDVLSAAEYPGYAREIGFSEAAEKSTQAVIDDDWRQYRHWFEKK
jgi:hypothetical protein